MDAFKILGMADEGKCEHCGANCPKRRVAVMPVDADGSNAGEPQYWGVICASKVRHGSKAVRHQSSIVAEAQRADLDREYNRRQKMARIAGELPVTIPCGIDCKVYSNSRPDAANRLYRLTGRKIVGSYFAVNAAGHTVRVDGSDAADVAFYASHGFVQSTEAVADMAVA